jgi:uncharacterized damage-inducible protein DinB
MVTKKDAIASESFQKYIDLVHEKDLMKALKKNSKQFKEFLEKLPKKKIDFAYAEGKWTIREVLQHIIDAERVFTYRAVTFARKDTTPLPSFDENNWAANANGAMRKWNDLLKEFKAVRKSTESLFASFTDEQLLSSGTASNKPSNPVALGFVCVGHAAHHIQIIKERYLKS